MTFDPTMTGDEMRQALRTLGFAGDRRENDQGFSAFARFIGKTPRTVIQWGETGPDSTAAVLLRLMLASDITAARAGELAMQPIQRGARGVRPKRRG